MAERFGERPKVSVVGPGNRRHKRVVATCLALATLAMLSAPARADGQDTQDVVVLERGGVGTHVLLGVTGGRLRLDAGERIDAFGGRAGVGLGELVQITGFYWRSVDVSDRPLIAANAWGGELQLNLNAGGGLSPFVAAGLARLKLDTLGRQTAATAGAGLLLPLGPVLLRVSAHDYVLGVSGLRGRHGPDETSHNWMFTVGATAALGRGRGERPVLIRPGTPVRASPETTVVAGERVGLRNYQSDRRIEVPLPLEGSITIRYGPDAQPIVSFSRPDGASGDASTLLSDPALRDWLRREISLQLSERIGQQQRTGEGALRDDITRERIIDEVLATVLPRMEAAEARRSAELREELRRVLAPEPPMARVTPEIEPGRESASGQPVPPRPAAPGAGDPAALFDAEEAGETARRMTVEQETQIRARFAELARRYPALLLTAETDRGPALVIADGAFRVGGVFAEARAQEAAREIAAALDLVPDMPVYVQGHADASGSELQNQRLSELRAEAVRSLLVQSGAHPGRIYAIGFGHGRPVASNATAEGRALNRRVEVVLGSTLVPVVRSEP